MKSISRSLVGIAGAHFVAAELSQRGYIATVTSRNTEGIDVLASSVDGLKTVSIQVKTSSAEQRKKFSRSWILQKKHENIFSDNFFYVFCGFKTHQRETRFLCSQVKFLQNMSRKPMQSGSRRHQKLEKNIKTQICDFLKYTMIPPHQNI